MRNALSFLSYSILIYIVLLGVHGYGYGGNDQIEIIPVLKYWSNPDLFPQDFFITHFSERNFTERTPLLLFLHYSFGYGPWAILFWHFAFSLLLISGLLKIACHLAGDMVLAVLAVTITLTIGYRTSLGGNELYYNLLIGSLVAKGFGAWAIYYWLQHRLLTPYILLGVAAYFQPLVSLQIMLIFGILHLSNLALFKRFLPGVLIYTMLAGPWIALLLFNRDTSIITAAEYLEIIEFRLAHHFLPQYFNWQDYLIFFGLVGVSWKYFHARNAKIVTFIKVTLGIMLIYSFSIIVLNSAAMVNTQWFKTSIWIEFFGVVAILSLIKQTTLFNTKGAIVVAASSFLALSFILKSWMSGAPPNYNQPFSQPENIELKLSEWAKDNTEPSGLFILPLSFTYFKNNAERSSFVDFKAMIHDEGYMNDMYAKIQRFYGVDLKSRRQGGMDDLNLVVPLSDEDIIEELVAEGVDFMVLPNSKAVPNAKPVITFGNERGWSVYQL